MVPDSLSWIERYADGRAFWLRFPNTHSTIPPTTVTPNSDANTTMRISNSCARCRQKFSLELVLSPVSARLPAIWVAGVPEEPAAEPVDAALGAGVTVAPPLLVEMPVLTGDEVGALMGDNVSVPALEAETLRWKIGYEYQS